MTEEKEHLYFINELYRDFLFPTILGEDNREILYWAGKRISRQYDISNLEDLKAFFNQAEFGSLKKMKERRTYIIFELSGQTVTDRLETGSKEFSLESGMIAETIGKMKGKIAECEVAINSKKKIVELTARFS